MKETMHTEMAPDSSNFNPMTVATIMDNKKFMYRYMVTSRRNEARTSMKLSSSQTNH